MKLILGILRNVKSTLYIEDKILNFNLNNFDISKSEQL